MKRNVILGLLAILLIFCIIGCDNGNGDDDPTVPKELLGIWIRGESECIITNNTYKFLNGENSFLVNIESFSLVTNENDSTKDDFPSGFNLNGKVLSITGTGLGINTNDNFSYPHYINATKDKFVIDNSIIIYEKQ